MKVMNYLKNQNHYFVMSVTHNCYSILFKYLEEKLTKWNMRSIWNADFMAIVWKYVGSKTKIVRWITNLDLDGGQDELYYDKVCNVLKITLRKPILKQIILHQLLKVFGMRIMDLLTFIINYILIFLLLPKYGELTNTN